MRAPERTLHVLSLGMAKSRRARFVEEWLADLAAARSVGLTHREVLAAAARVALLLGWLHLRGHFYRVRTRAELAGTGVAVGFVLVLTDVSVATAVPFVILVVASWGVRRVRLWVTAGR